MQTSVAQQVYRCEVGGRILYQDQPCAGGKGTSLKVHSSKPSPDQDSARKVLEREQAIRAGIAANMRIQELERERLDLLTQRDIARSRMDREIAALRDLKRHAANNLAGATWEQSLSTEMQAIATRYNGEIDRINASIQDIDRQINELKQKK